MSQLSRRDESGARSNWLNSVSSLMTMALASNLKIKPYIALGRDLLELVDRLRTTWLVERNTHHVSIPVELEDCAIQQRSRPAIWVCQINEACTPR
jgi:hypothetical protein